MARSRESVRWTELAILVVVLAVGVALRTWQLGTVPPGLTHDEAGNGYDAAAVLRGVRPLYFSVGYGREPLYQYSVALVMSVLGATDTALRLTTVGWGVLVLLLSYAFAQHVFGSLTALLTVGWMAISFWPVMTSRVGLRAITSTALFATSAYSFALGSEWLRVGPGAGIGRCRWLWWGLSGVFLGASIYTYMASRAMPAVYLLFLGYLSMRHLVVRGTAGTSTHDAGHRWGRIADPLRQHWIGISLLLLIAALVAAPLVHHLVVNPGVEQRVEQLSAPLEDALRGDLGALWAPVGRSLPMFTFRGDPLWLYNIPGRPLLGPTGGALFYAGLMVCLFHFWDPRYGFLLLWLVVGASPALVTGPDATALRSITAQPAVFMTAGVGLTTAVRFLLRRVGYWGRVATAGALAVLFVLTGVDTVDAYFNVWAQHRDVRVAYHHALVEQARYLEGSPQGGTVSISSIYPGRYHDPYTMEMSLRRDDLSLRWFDGRYALTFPSSGEGRVIIPSAAPLDPALAPLMMSHGSRLHSERFRGDDLVTGFDVYRFDSEQALADVLRSVRDNPAAWSISTTFPEDAPTTVYQTLDLPAALDGMVSLLGYNLRTPTIECGGEIELLTVWQVHENVVPEMVAFVHLLGADGQIIGQLDRLDVPSWHWEPGDAFVQLHRFPVDADVRAGVYPLSVGLYQREDSRRLPIMMEDVVVGDRILLRPVEVVGE